MLKSTQRKMGVVLTYLTQVVQIISTLLYMPIMLRILGKNEYGIYQLANSTVSYLGLMSLGFSAAYIRFYSRYAANKENESIDRLNGMFLTIFAVIAVVSAVAGAVMTVNVKEIFGNKYTDAELNTAKILMALLTANMSISFLGAVFDCNTTAQEMFVFQRLLRFFQTLLNPFITLPLLISGFGSIGVVIVATVLSIAKFVANIYYNVKKMHMRFRFGQFDFCLFREMFAFTFFIFLNQIIDTINLSIDKLLLGRMIGGEAVAEYAVGGQINTLYLTLAVTVSSVFVPEVHRIVAKDNDNVKLTDLFTKVGRLQFIIVALVLSGFIFFGKEFVALWGGKDYSKSFYVALVLMAAEVVDLIQNLGIEIQRAKNMHKTRSIVFFFLSLGNIMISIPLIRSKGVVGAAIGTAICSIMGNLFFMNWFYQKRIGINICQYWKSIFSFIPALCLPVTIGLLLKKLISIDNFIKLCIAIITFSICYFTSMWILGMNNEEKDILRRLKGKLHQS